MKHDKARCTQCRLKRQTRRMVRTWIGPAFKRFEWRCPNVVACWFRRQDRERPSLWAVQS